MKKMLFLLAVGCLGLMLSTPAHAQFYPQYPGQGGTSVGIYTPNWGFSYSNQQSMYGPGFGYGGFQRPQPHLDYHQGGFVPHRGHFHYVPPHTDVHLGRRSYQVVPTPYGSYVSPAPHFHR